MSADNDFFCPPEMINVYPAGATLAQTFAVTNGSTAMVASSALSGIGPGSIFSLSSQSSVKYVITNIASDGVTCTIAGPYTGPYTPVPTFPGGVPVPPPQPSYPGTPLGGYTGTTNAAATITVYNGVDLTCIFPNQPYARRIFVGSTGSVVVRTRLRGRLCTLAGVPTGAHVPDAQYTAIDASTGASALAVGM